MFLLRESEAADDPDLFAELIEACRQERPISETVGRALTELGVEHDPEDVPRLAAWWAGGLVQPAPRLRRSMVAALQKQAFE